MFFHLLSTPLPSIRPQTRSFHANLILTFDIHLSREIPPPFSFSGFKVKKSAKWPIRGWHYHTEHPLELTNFLNGWGLTSPDDEVGWKSMLPEWGLYLEWLVANRQNAIEFLLLAADDWSSFVSSPIRQGRFKQITDLALQWGVAVAADVPIASTSKKIIVNTP